MALTTALVTVVVGVTLIGLTVISFRYVLPYVKRRREVMQASRSDMLLFESLMMLAPDLIGGFLATFCVVAITVVTIIYLTVLEPRILQERRTGRASVEYLFRCLADAYLASNVFFNLFMGLFVPPGFIDENGSSGLEEQPGAEKEKGGEESKSSQNDANPGPVNGTPGPGNGVAAGTPRRFCRTCRVPKVARAYHCTFCERCVLRMDHHCIWLNQCIGAGNYRFFFLFLFWLPVGCFYVDINLSSQFKKVMHAIPVAAAVSICEGAADMGTAMVDAQTCAPVDVSLLLQKTIVVCFCLAAVTGGAVMTLLVFHIIISSRNLSTVEFSHAIRDKNSPLHDRGRQQTVLQNLAERLGIGTNQFHLLLFPVRRTSAVPPGGYEQVATP